MAENRYEIHTTDDAGIYEGLRALWCEVFGDEPEYVDGTYEILGEDIKGYAVTDEDGKVVSALTSYICGSYMGKPAYVSYAVCTAPDHRGSGLAARLVELAKEDALAKGGISLVSPSEPSLEAWYGELGYEPHFYASACTLFALEDDDEEYEDFDEYDLDMGEGEGAEPFRPGIDLKAVDRKLYNKYREAFLADRPHIELSDAMLKLAEFDCEEDGGLFVINGGDAICTITTAKGGSLVMAEFILSPVLEELSLEIDSEITTVLARQLGDYEVTYSMPGARSCQAMAAGLEAAPEESEPLKEAYYGFPIM